MSDYYANFAPSLVFNPLIVHIMSVIRNTASALRVGRVGNESYYVNRSQQIVRVAQNNSNYGATASRTNKQQANRVRWANLVNFYKISSHWMAKAFETRKPNQSDYNRFMQINKPTARIALTKDAALNGAVVVDEFIISQGSLPSVEVNQVGSLWLTNISVGSLVINDTTTVAEFSRAVVAANSWLTYGMQISFISYQQFTNTFGFPVATCASYEVTLADDNAELLRKYLPSFCSVSSPTGFLGTSAEVSVGGFAYIISSSMGSKTRVSSQVLINNNALMIQQYSSEKMLQEAIASYGVTADVFLDSGSAEQNPLPGVTFIEYMSKVGTTATWRPNDGYVSPDDLADGQFLLHFSRATLSGSATPKVLLVPKDGVTIPAATAKVIDNVTLQFDMPDWSEDDELAEIRVDAATASYRIVFGA